MIILAGIYGDPRVGNEVVGWGFVPSGCCLHFAEIFGGPSFVFQYLVIKPRSMTPFSVPFSR